LKLQVLDKNLYCWSEQHGKENAYYHWYSYVLKHPNGNLLIVDPLPSNEELKEEIENIGKPKSILLTCNYHSRDSAKLAKRWNAEIFLHKRGRGEEDVSIDRYFELEDSIWDDLKLIDVSPLSWKEEVAIVFGSNLLVLDALIGGRKDIGVEVGSVGIHPNRFSMGHIKDKEKAKNKIIELAHLKVTNIFFGHGYPVLNHAKTELLKLSANLLTWKN